MVDKVSKYKWSSYKRIPESRRSEIMEMAWRLFGSKKAYEKFHELEEHREYLEIKEDLEKYREEAAQRATGDVCRKYGIVDGKEIYAHPEIFTEIVKEIRKNSKMSRRKIAKFIGASESMVRRSLKKV